MFTSLSDPLKFAGFHNHSPLLTMIVLTSLYQQTHEESPYEAMDNDAEGMADHDEMDDIFNHQSQVDYYHETTNNGAFGDDDDDIAPTCNSPVLPTYFSPPPSPQPTVE